MAIAVTCPSCGFDGEAPDETAGQTVLCPDCRFNIPVPSNKSRSDDRNRFRDEPPPRRRDEDRPSRRPVDDDDDIDDRPSRRRSRRRGSGEVVCHRCGSDAPPITKSQISAAGWTTFVLLLLCFWPLCFLGLFMKEEWRACRDCGARL